MRITQAIRHLFFSILTLWSLAVSNAFAQTTTVADKPIQFPEFQTIQGTDSIFTPGSTILIGEVHGTWETPVLVATLVRQAAQQHLDTVLCIEVSSSEQESLDLFLNSDGGAEAKSKLLKESHWRNQDGRASVGIFAMLELIRRLRSEGKRIQLVAMDLNLNLTEEDIGSLSPEKIKELEGLANKRDEVMAKAVIHAREKLTDGVVIAYAGNVHTRITKGTAWDSSYTPMGWHIAQKVNKLISLDAEYAGGQAWVTTERGSGPTNFSGKDLGAVPFVKLFEDSKSGYHGTLYVGRITAAKPALGTNVE